MEGSGPGTYGLIEPSVTDNKYDLTARMVPQKLDITNEYHEIPIQGNSDLTTRNNPLTVYRFTLDQETQYFDLRQSYFRIKFHVEESPGVYYAGAEAIEMTNSGAFFDRVTCSLNGNLVQDLKHADFADLALGHLFMNPAQLTAMQISNWELDTLPPGSSPGPNDVRYVQCKSTGTSVIRSNYVTYQPGLGLFSTDPVFTGARLTIELYRNFDAKMLFGSTASAATTTLVKIEEIVWFVPTPVPIAPVDKLTKSEIIQKPIRSYFIHPDVDVTPIASGTVNINEYIGSLKKMPRAIIVAFKYATAVNEITNATPALVNFGLNAPLKLTNFYIDLGGTRYPQNSYSTNTTESVSLYDYTRQFTACQKLNGMLGDIKEPGMLFDYQHFHDWYFYTVVNFSEVPVSTLIDENLNLHISAKCENLGVDFFMVTIALMDGEIEYDAVTKTSLVHGY